MMNKDAVLGELKNNISLKLGGLDVDFYSDSKYDWVLTNCSILQRPLNSDLILSVSVVDIWLCLLHEPDLTLLGHENL